MSGTSNAKNDTIQILAFTFFLCALFFGAWGGYMHWKLKKARVARARSVNTIKKFEKFFADPKMMAQVDDYRRKQEISGAGSDSASGISTIVQNVIDSMPRGANRPKIKNRRDDSKDTGNIRTLSTSFELEPTSLKTLVYFIQSLEQNDHDLDITRVGFSRQRPKKGDDPNKPRDVWNTEQFKIITHIPVKSGQ